MCRGGSCLLSAGIGILSVRACMLKKLRSYIVKLGLGSYCLLCLDVGGASADEYFELSPMTYIESEDAINGLVLTAKFARYNPDEQKAVLTQVDAKIRDDKGVQGFELTSEKGLVDFGESVFIARGNVLGKMPDGRLLSTEVMQYDQEEAVISSDLPVEILEGKMSYRGRKGFIYDVRKGSFRLLGGASLEQIR